MSDPQFKNKENLIYCLNTPFAYYDYEGLGKFSKKEVLNLIQDLDTFFDYITETIHKEPFGEAEFFNQKKMDEFIKNKEKMRIDLVDITSNVWSGIWHFHEDVVPKKYK